MDILIEKLIEMSAMYGPRLIGAIIVLIVGLWLIKVFLKGIRNLMETKNTNLALRGFLHTLANVLLKILLFISVLGMIGVEMTSFIAILGAAGLAVGLALQGSLQNFAGGVVLLVFKPFKIGDFIEAQGHTGVVKEIQIFNTILTTPDKKVVIIPNAGLANGSLINYSTEPVRRVDWTFGIAYGDNADNAKQVFKDLLLSNEKVLKEPEIFIALKELGNSSVNFTVRAWVNSPDYWEVFFWMNEQVYKTFAQEGLHIPFPQMDVHVHNK